MTTANAPAFQVIQTNPAIGDRGLMHVYGADPATPRPYVLAIHGGGWRNGDPTSFAWMWPRIKALDVALVLPTYRLAPAFRFPCAYDDLVHLLAWLRDNGTAHGLDASGCLLFGSSAGGHLAMLLATRATKENRPMPCLRGVVSYCGSYDLAAQYTRDSQHGASMVSDFLGGPPEANAPLYHAASPIGHVHDRMPPIWMAHGTTDAVVPVAQSRDLVRALVAAGGDPIYLEVRAVGHTMVESDPNGKVLEPYQLLFEADVLRFMHRTLSQPRGP